MTFELPKPELITKENTHDILEELHKEAGPFALDLEFTGIDLGADAPGGARGAKIVAFTLACRDRWGRYRCWFGWADHLAAFGPWLETAPVTGHNIYGPDYHLLWNHGIVLQNIVCDTLDLHRFLTNGRVHRAKKPHGLKTLLKGMFGIAQPEFAGNFMRYAVKEERVKKNCSRRTKDGITYLYGTHVTDLKRVPVSREDLRGTPLEKKFIKYAALDALGGLLVYERLVQELA